jgi:hypothetical protein
LLPHFGIFAKSLPQYLVAKLGKQVAKLLECHPAVNVIILVEFKDRSMGNSVGQRHIWSQARNEKTAGDLMWTNN